jgi:hypothetical protein
MLPVIVDGSSIPADFSKSVAGNFFSTLHDDVAACLHAQSLVTLPIDYTTKITRLSSYCLHGSLPDVTPLIP